MCDLHCINMTPMLYAITVYFCEIIVSINSNIVTNRVKVHNCLLFLYLDCLS